MSEAAADAPSAALFRDLATKDNTALGSAPQDALSTQLKVAGAVAELASEQDAMAVSTIYMRDMHIP